MKSKPDIVPVQLSGNVQNQIQSETRTVSTKQKYEYERSTTSCNLESSREHERGALNWRKKKYI